jgi:hypothetical protein
LFVQSLLSHQVRGRRVMSIQKWVLSISTSVLFSIVAGPALADCSALPSWQDLKTALTNVVAAGGNGGLGFNMWGTLVSTDGTVCAVAFSGSGFVDQWLGSRVISAQKANTANAFSLGKGSTPATSLFGTAGLALSTANLFTAVQPGGSLYGLQHSNPVDTEIAYGNGNGQPGFNQASFQQGQSNAANFGTPRDPMVGERIGGVNVFLGTGSESAGSASAAIPLAQTTWLPGKFGILSGSIRSMA